MKRYFREHCLLELRHASRPTDIVSFEIEEFNVERVGSPIPKQDSPLKRSFVMWTHTRTLDVLGRESRTKCDTSLDEESCESSKRRRWSKTKRRASKDANEDGVRSLPKRSPHQARLRRVVQTPNTPIDVSHFHDLEE